MAVQQRGDRGRVADDPGHVAGGRERADPQRAVGVRGELRVQPVEVDVAVGVLRDHHDVGDRLAPGQLVGVVLVRADEHDRPPLRRDGLGRPVALVRCPQAEDADQLVDRAGRAGSAEDDQRVLVAADGVADDPARVLAQAGGLQPGAAGLGVRVRVAGEHLAADEVLQEAERPPGGGVVGVRHPPRTVRARHDLVVADDGLADPAQQRGLGWRAHALTVEPTETMRSLIRPGVRTVLITDTCPSPDSSFTRRRKYSGPDRPLHALEATWHRPRARADRPGSPA